MFRVIFEPDRGQRVPIRIWARQISEDTVRQLQRLAARPYVVDFVAAMADAHVSEGVAVGSVFATERTVVPRALGGDLGCGMSARRLGVDVPIVPGIMPISNFSQLKRFSDACGAEIPRWIGKRMQAFGDDVDSIREFAADFVAQMCQRLVAGGAPGLHFYTLNLSRPTLGVLSRLG